MCQVDAQCRSNPQMTRLAAAPSGAGLNSLALTDLYRRLVVGSGSSHPFLNLSGHGEEGLLNVRGILGRCLEEGDSETVSKFLCKVSASTLCIHNVSRLAFATVYSTTFLSDMSLLFPTSSLFTPSVAYRSISCSHCLTLLNESMSVTSYTTQMPCAPR